MNTIKIPCSCGSKGCSTELIIEVDEENKANLRLIINDEKHEYSSWISLDKANIAELFKGVQKKWKGFGNVNLQ